MIRKLKTGEICFPDPAAVFDGGTVMVLLSMSNWSHLKLQTSTSRSAEFHSRDYTRRY